MQNNKSFNNWFCKQICQNNIDYTLFTNDVLDEIVRITEWDKDIISNTDVRNVIYWYSLYLLYMYKDFYYYDEVYQFLNNIAPFNN